MELPEPHANPPLASSHPTEGPPQVPSGPSARLEATLSVSPRETEVPMPLSLITASRHPGDFEVNSPGGPHDPHYIPTPKTGSSGAGSGATAGGSTGSQGEAAAGGGGAHTRSLSRFSAPLSPTAAAATGGSTSPPLGPPLQTMSLDLTAGTRGGGGGVRFRGPAIVSPSGVSTSTDATAADATAVMAEEGLVVRGQSASVRSAAPGEEPGLSDSVVRTAAGRARKVFVKDVAELQGRVELLQHQALGSRRVGQRGSR